MLYICIICLLNERKKPFKRNIIRYYYTVTEGNAIQKRKVKWFRYNRSKQQIQSTSQQTDTIHYNSKPHKCVEYADKLPKDNLSRLFSLGFPTTHNSAKWIAKPCPVVLRVCGREWNICSTAKSGAEGSLVSYCPTRMHIEQLVYEITVGCWSAGRTSTTINETLTKIHVHSQRETKQLVKRYFYRNIQTNKKKKKLWQMAHTCSAKKGTGFQNLTKQF